MSARDLSLLGANQRLPYQRRMASRTCPSLTLNGSRLSGVMASPWSSCGTMDGEPQNSQRCAARVPTKTEIAWQLWHLTS